MRYRSPLERDVDECASRIKLILQEYNCALEDDESFGVVLVDKDNKDFVEMEPLSKHEY